MHLEQFNSLIKLSISVAFFFFLGKISCKTFKSENKSIPLRSKKLSGFKKPLRLTQYFFKLS